MASFLSCFGEKVNSKHFWFPCYFLSQLPGGHEGLADGHGGLQFGRRIVGSNFQFEDIASMDA